MVVTTPIRELLAHARRCEVEGRWPQAADSYKQALDNMTNPHSGDNAADRAMLEGLHMAAVARSREAPASDTLVNASEAAKHAADHTGAMMAEKRARAIHGETQG